MKEKTASLYLEDQGKTGQGQISTETKTLRSYPYGFASGLHSGNTTLTPREETRCLWSVALRLTPNATPILESWSG